MAAVVVVLMALVGCTTSTHAARALGGASPAAPAEVLTLPGNGWKPGDLRMEALLIGPLRIQRTPEGACAWLGTGSSRSAVLWPDGYRVRFSQPAELLDPAGRVVAHEGELIEAGGGQGQTRGPSRCSDGRTTEVSVIQSDVRPQPDARGR